MPFKYLFPVALLAAVATTQTPTSGCVPALKNAVGDSNIRPVHVSGDTTFYENGFFFVETPPKYPGGEEALINYLSHNIRYPKAARKAHIGGTVRVGFIVDSTGQITNAQAWDSLGYGLEEEATRVIREMKPWKPGAQQGKPVNVKYMLPIKFFFQ